MRRTPIQRRSVERVDQMLDAAAVLLDEGGYDALSTREVAARTGLPIGSIYRYFGDKRELADALAARNLDRFVAAISARVEGVTHWDDLVDHVVDEYVRMKATVPGFAVHDFGDNAGVAEALAELLAGRMSVPHDDLLRRTLLTSIEAADGLLRTHHRDPVMVEETKELLRAYLARRLGPRQLR